LEILSRDIIGAVPRAYDIKGFIPIPFYVILNAAKNLGKTGGFFTSFRMPM
jgi:hypothetical protein